MIRSSRRDARAEVRNGEVGKVFRRCVSSTFPRVRPFAGNEIETLVDHLGSKNR